MIIKTPQDKTYLEEKPKKTNKPRFYFRGLL